MARKAGDEKFVVTEGSEVSSGVFSGKTPRQAALKAARRLEPADSEEVAERVEIRLREEGTYKVHIYEGWAWKEKQPDDAPDWMPDEITKGNVKKREVEFIEKSEHG